MKSTDQHKQDTLINENSKEETNKIVEQLIASKKILQRNRITVSFLSEASTSPNSQDEKIIIPAKNSNRLSDLSVLLPEFSTSLDNNDTTKGKPIVKEFSPKSAPKKVITKQVEQKTITVKKEIPFIPTKQLERNNTRHTHEQIKSMNHSAPATISGGTSARHVTDTPYAEDPVVGKNLVPRSEEIHEILSYVPNWMIRWGNSVILLIIGGMMAMSYYIKYPDVVSGGITINSSYPPVAVVSKTTGAITLFKEDKATVLTEDAIGVIKNTAIYEDVMTLKSVLVDFQEKLNKGRTLSFYQLPKGLQLGELQIPYNQLFLKLKEQEIQYQSDKNNITRKNNIDQQLLELAAIQKAKEKSLSIKYQEYLKAKKFLDTRYKVLHHHGGISTEQLNVRESEVRNLLDFYQNDRMAFNEIKKRILDLNINKSELDFQQEDQEIISHSSLTTAFETLKMAIQNWEKDYVLKAPIAGTLNFIRFTKSDMYLQQDQPIAHIIPTVDSVETGGTIFGELFIPSMGAGKVAIGQVVNIELSDYPKKQYGVVLGTIESVSNVTISMGDGKGTVGYKALVNLPKGLENTLKKDIQFKHSMQGKAEIITKDIRLIERFFLEFRDLVDAD